MKEEIAKYPKPDKIKRNTILLIITIILILITASILLSAIYIIYNSKDIKTQDNQTSSRDNQEQSQLDRIEIQTKIQECAIPHPSEKCALLYSTPDIEDKCQELENNLEDQCIYNFAIINQRPDSCETITDTTLKNKCEDDVSNFFISEE